MEPPRCITCGKVLGGLYKPFKARVAELCEDGKSEDEANLQAFTEFGINPRKYCCKNWLMNSVDVSDSLHPVPGVEPRNTGEEVREGKEVKIRQVPRTIRVPGAQVSGGIEYGEGVIAEKGETKEEKKETEEKEEKEKEAEVRRRKKEELANKKLLELQRNRNRLLSPGGSKPIERKSIFSGLSSVDDAEKDEETPDGAQFVPAPEKEVAKGLLSKIDPKCEKFQYDADSLADMTSYLLSNDMVSRLFKVLGEMTSQISRDLYVDLIVDAFASIGGDTLAFANYPNVRRVKAFEVSEVRFRMLKANVKNCVETKKQAEIGLYNEDFFSKDIKVHMETVGTPAAGKKNVLYLDPPVPGLAAAIESRRLDKIMVGDIELTDFLLSATEKGKDTGGLACCTLIVVKVPNIYTPKPDLERYFETASEKAGRQSTFLYLKKRK
jgi:DNA-directed RNA polymerase subunit N (RpoN/RPB10)